MFKVNNSIIFITFITAVSTILGLIVNVYSYVSHDVSEPLSALLYIFGLFASVSLFRGNGLGGNGLGQNLVKIFWLCQTFVVGWSGTKLGFSFALAISLHFNITPESYVVINLIGVIMAVLCFLKLNKSEVKAQAVRA